MGDSTNQESSFDTLNGAFIGVNRIHRGKVTHDRPVFIKLTEIKSVHPESKHRCTFFTYKDCEYYCYLGYDELMKAVNYFIFNPEEYFEQYGY